MSNVPTTLRDSSLTVFRLSPSPAPTPGPSLPNPHNSSSSLNLSVLVLHHSKAQRVLSDPRPLAMPHRQQGAPKGCVTVRVGAEGEDQRRFAVPLGHLSHPLFAELLEEAEREYGFRHQGAIAIPCRVDRFVHVEQLIDRDLGEHRHLVDLDNCGATAEGGQSHNHIHLPRFVGCFRD